MPRRPIALAVTLAALAGGCQREGTAAGRLTWIRNVSGV